MKKKYLVFFAVLICFSCAYKISDSQMRKNAGRENSEIELALRETDKIIEKNTTYFHENWMLSLKVNNTEYYRDWVFNAGESVLFYVPKGKVKIDYVISSYDRPASIFSKNSIDMIYASRGWKTIELSIKDNEMVKLGINNTSQRFVWHHVASAPYMSVLLPENGIEVELIIISKDKKNFVQQ